MRFLLNLIIWFGASLFGRSLNEVSNEKLKNFEPTISNTEASHDHIMLLVGEVVEH